MKIYALALHNNKMILILGIVPAWRIQLGISWLYPADCFLEADLRVI